MNQIIVKVLKILRDNPKTNINEFGLSKEELFDALEIIKDNNLAKGIKLIRGGFGNPILMAIYDAAKLTLEGSNFIKENTNTEQLSSTSGSNNSEIKKSCIFLSYSWNDSKLADKIDKELTSLNLLVKRDVRDLGSWKSIKEFMSTIREQDFSIIILSKSYIESPNCMYEVTELIKDSNYKDKIFPVVTEDANIYKPIGRIQYIKYWEAEYEKLKNDLESIKSENRAELDLTLRRYRQIELTIAEFLDLVSDMNNPKTCDVVESIIEKLKVSKVSINKTESNADAINKKTAKRMFDTNSLSNEAIELLQNACIDRSGSILIIRTLSGLSITANGREFIMSNDHRDEVKWESAVEELCNSGFVKSTGYKNEIFRVTSDGYNFFDYIGNGAV